MDRGDWERLASLYGPILVALLLWILKSNGNKVPMPRGLQTVKPKRFAGVGCLLGVLWVTPGLVGLQALNLRFDWWTFAAGSAATLRGMPLELLLGWIVLWGVVSVLVAEWIGIWGSAASMLAFDCVFMPLCTTSVRLGRWWLVGEAVAVCVVLVPAICLAEWTRRGSHLKARAGLQAGAAAGLFLYLAPEIIFSVRPGAGWSALLSMAGWKRQLWLEGIGVLAVPGLSAVMEFAGRGGGTPIPYDPPVRLVSSGVYRYLANPMQVSCSLAMVALATMIGSGWMVLAAGISVIYSAGIAAWDEGDDLRKRFGEEWAVYRTQVRNWWPRWRPYCAGEAAVVYIARGCGPCSEVRLWLEARSPLGIRILDAEVLPQGSIRRMRYVGADGAREDGVRAFARCLEHLHLGWAWCGAAMRLPGVWWLLQVVMDACGLGPREVCAIENDAGLEIPGIRRNG